MYIGILVHRERGASKNNVPYKLESSNSAFCTPTSGFATLIF